MAEKRYVVKALGVQPTLEEGALSGIVQRGGAVPSNATQEWLDHALSLDLIEEGKQEGGIVVFAGDGSELAPVATAPEGSEEHSRSRRTPQKAD